MSHGVGCYFTEEGLTWICTLDSSCLWNFLRYCDVRLRQRKCCNKKCNDKMLGYLAYSHIYCTAEVRIWDFFFCKIHHHLSILLNSTLLYHSGEFPYWAKEYINELIMLQFAFGIKIPTYCCFQTVMEPVDGQTWKRKIQKPHPFICYNIRIVYKMKAFSLLFLEKQANKPTNQMYLKSWAYKEGFFSIIIASRMQCILPRGSQLSSSKRVSVRNTAKTDRAWSYTNPGWFAVAQSYYPS